MSEHTAWLAQAWAQCYLDPLAARDMGQRLADTGGPLAAAGWVHVALAEVRVGDAALAFEAIGRARSAVAAGDVALPLSEPEVLTWCDEIEAIALRRKGDYEGSARLQGAIDSRMGTPASELLRFVAHNSRAITAKLRGRCDDAMHHFYAASDAAQRTGLNGPRITALANLGGYHQALYNLEDARSLSERALAAARESGAQQIVITAASNLILIYHALGQAQQARAMVEYLVNHEDELQPGALRRAALPLALGHLGVGEIEQALSYLEAGAVAGVADGDGITMWAWLRARCLLARGDATGARDLAQRTLEQRRQCQLSDQPYEMMELQRALADACEHTGDLRAALACMREVYARYEQLVGRSARARFIALEVSHQLAQAQRERDLALDSRRSAEDDRRRLADLNTALQAQMQQTEMLHARLREQALRDPLTGLHNRRHLFEIAPALLDLARRQERPLCVVILDLDHFKLLNDTYGHQAGDLMLQRFATLMLQVLRRSDVLCRYGGEEFVAVMPEFDAVSAQGMLARLLQAFQERTVEPGRRPLPGGSFSAGVAQFPSHGSTLEQLLSRADRALYAAKKLGRARIELAPLSGFGALV